MYRFYLDAPTGNLSAVYVHLVFPYNYCVTIAVVSTGKSTMADSSLVYLLKMIERRVVAEKLQT